MDTETINDIRAIQAGIGALKYRPDLHDLERQSHEIRLCHIRDALPEMYAALRAEQERENPQALTLEQLKEMEGKPVYISGMWRVIEDAGSKVVRFTDGEWVPSYQCGITWLAYAHEPK